MRLQYFTQEKIDFRHRGDLGRQGIGYNSKQRDSQFLPQFSKPSMEFIEIVGGED